MLKKKLFFLANTIIIAMLAIAFFVTWSPAYMSSSSYSGKYVGTYYYSTNIAPVSFTAIMVIEDGSIIGMMREPKTFGDGEMPYLYADIIGTISSDGNVKFVKTYDGTGDVSHSVNYEGKMNFNNKSITGVWIIEEDWTGSFEMQKK